MAKLSIDEEMEDVHDMPMPFKTEDTENKDSILIGNPGDKYCVQVSRTHGPICCGSFRFDQRASSVIGHTHPTTASEIKEFMSVISLGHFKMRKHPKTEDELVEIEAVFKVNVRPLNHFDACTFLFCPATGEDGIQFECFKFFAEPQEFPAVGENSQLSYWCKEHKLMFRVGCLKVRWGANGGWATTGNYIIDDALGLPAKETVYYGQ